MTQKIHFKSKNVSVKYRIFSGCWAGFWLLSSFLVALSVRSWMCKCVCVCMHVCARDRESKGERERERWTLLSGPKASSKISPLGSCPLTFVSSSNTNVKQVDGDRLFFIGLDLTLGYFNPAGGRKWNCL